MKATNLFTASLHGKDLRAAKSETKRAIATIWKLAPWRVILPQGANNQLLNY